MTMSSKATLLFLWSSLCLGGEAFASDAKTPYELNVVLNVETNRLLSDTFKARLQRELQDWLREAFGDLARVKVALSDDTKSLAEVLEPKRFAEVRERGLAALEGWRGPSPAKTHFVFVRFVDGVYELQARQYDGLTGLVSPLRIERSRSPETLSKTAASLVSRDFGLVATVGGGSGAQDTVKMQIHGGERGVSLSRWIDKDQVFALVPVLADGSAGPRVAWALLRVTEPPKVGSATCTCKLFYRYSNPLSSGVPHRCLKLGTTRGPLRIRVVQEGPDNSARPLEAAISIDVSPDKFSDESALKSEVAPSNNGKFDSGTLKEKKEYDHVAFVQVQTKPSAKVPVPILEDQVIEIKVRTSRDKAMLDKLAREDFANDVAESYRIQTQLFQELQKLTSRKEDRVEALKRAQEGLDRSKKDHKELSEQFDNLEKKTVNGKRFDLSKEEDRLKKIKSGEKELARFVIKLEDIEKKEKDPRRKAWSYDLDRAEKMQRSGEYDDAIALYKDLLKSGFDLDGTSREDLIAKVATLEKEWQPKDGDHRKARAFVFKTWTKKLTAAELKQYLEEAHKSLAELRKKKDLITMVRFGRELEQHGLRVQEDLKNLSDLTAEETAQIKVIKELGPELQKLGAEVTQFLEELTSEKK